MRFLREARPKFWLIAKRAGRIEQRAKRARAGKIAAAPRSPEAAYGWGYAGSRYEGPTRGLPIQDAASYQGGVAFTGKLPLPMSNGFHILPGDIKEAALFMAERGVLRIWNFRKSQLTKFDGRARLLTPKLYEIRDKLTSDHFARGARLRTPLSEEPLTAHGLGLRIGVFNFCTASQCWAI